VGTEIFGRRSGGRIEFLDVSRPNEKAIIINARIIICLKIIITKSLY